MDLRQLECFLEVKSQLHFGRAAERLYLAQPTVSESIRRLERELGGALFDRTTRRVALTPLGEAFAVEAQQAYEAVQAAYARGRAMAEQQQRQFAVGYTGDYDPLVDVVVRLQRECPGVLVTLRAMPTPRLVAALDARKLHAAICWEPPSGDDLETLGLGVSHLVAVVPDAHPWAALDHITLRELADEPLVAWPRAVNPVAYDRFTAAMDATGVPWALVGTAAGADNVLARVLSGFGVGLLYQAIAEARRVPGVSYVRVADDAAAFERKLVWRRDERHPAMEPFVALLRERHAELARRG
jgi:DNA-binding transcriptional LysR family regulator